MQEIVDLLGPAYARNGQYWKVLLFSGIFQGLFMGALALAFMNYYTLIMQNTWFQGSYTEALSILRAKQANVTIFERRNGAPPSLSPEEQALVNGLKLGGGEWWYVGLLTGAGFVVGLFKVLWTALLPAHPFPEKIPGFLHDLKVLNAPDLVLPLAFLIVSGLSIGLGASLGPEAALASAGTALGTLIGRRWKIGPFQATSRSRSIKELEDQQEHDYPRAHKVMAALLPDFSQTRDLCCLDGLAAAFGGIFPTPFLSTLLIHELGNHWGPGGRFAVTETIARTGVAAIVSYALFVSVQNRTLLEVGTLPIAFYDLVPDLSLKYLGYGVLFGVISGLVGFVGMVFLVYGNIAGIVVTRLSNRLGEKLNLPKGVLGRLMTPTIGGTLLGLLYVAAPLNIGEGATQLSAIIAVGPLLGKQTMLVTAFLKLLCLGISLGFGFVGGPFFPMLFAGGCLGSGMYQSFPGIPSIVAIPTCIAGVSTAIMPGIFSFTSFVSIGYVLGGPLTAVVFLTCITSYSTACGLGLIQNFLLRITTRFAPPKPEFDDDYQETLPEEAANPLIHSASYSVSTDKTETEGKADDEVVAVHVENDGAEDEFETTRQEDSNGVVEARTFSEEP